MKYYGRIGYVDTVESDPENRPGVYEEVSIERKYRGDVMELSSRHDASTETTNENISIKNQISIVADPFAYAHFSAIRYAEFMNTFWEVTSVKVSRPRLILTIGGKYNGDTNRSS